MSEKTRRLVMELYADVDREVAAAPLVIGPATTELTELTATLSHLSLRLLEVPLDPRSPQ